MQKSGRHRIDGALIVGTLLIVGLYLCLYLYTGKDPFGASHYNTYTRQAMAWRSGMTHLPEDVPVLELAVYRGDFYVSFPPLPSVVLWPLTFVFGMQTPDALLVKLYVYGAFLIVYFLLKSRGMRSWFALIWSLLLVYASSMLPMTLDGAVWYQAQTLGFLLTMGAVSCMVRGRATWSALLFALSIGCRPSNAPYLLALLAVYCWQNRQVPLGKALRGLLPGLLCGLGVAVVLFSYNMLRFSSPLEFGHSYLPEFTRNGDAFFDLSRIRQNAERLLFGWPFRPGTWMLETFGFTMLLANPAGTVVLGLGICDACRRRFSVDRVVIALCALVQGMLLLSTHYGGGFQYGARYFVDLLPYATLYLALRPIRRSPAWWWYIPDLLLLISAACLTVYGALTVSI